MKISSVATKTRLHKMKGFTGAVKFGLECGSVVHLTIGSDFEVPYTLLQDLDKENKIIDKIFEKVDQKFYGTMVFYFKDGTVTKYHWTKNLDSYNMLEFVNEDIR